MLNLFNAFEKLLATSFLLTQKNLDVLCQQNIVFLAESTFSVSKREGISHFLEV